MDTLIRAGDHGVCARGYPAVIDGAQEIMQRALLRLCVRKGSFALDPALGSELHRLRFMSGQHLERAALAYVQEALAPMRELRVLGVQCEQRDGLLCVNAKINCGGGAYPLLVEVA